MRYGVHYEIITFFVAAYHTKTGEQRAAPGRSKNFLELFLVYMRDAQANPHTSTPLQTKE
jgi:hypothetical protein